MDSPSFKFGTDHSRLLKMRYELPTVKKTWSDYIDSYADQALFWWWMPV
jgi:hypothetical protein